MDIWKLLASFGSGSLLTAVICVEIYKNPNAAKLWLSYFYDFLALFFDKFKYSATKYSLESRINGFVSALPDSSDINSTKVKIEWSARDDQEKCLIEENQVILVMRDRESKNRNFVHAAYFFTSNMLLWRTKRHISKKQSQALDIYTTKKIIEKGDSSALRVFLENYFQPLLEDNNISNLVGRFIEIDKSGFYTNILLSELSSLGFKTLMKARSADVIVEVKDLIEFLFNFATREQGDDTVIDVFTGKYSRCSIKIVSTYAVRHQDKISSPAKRIENTFAKGAENIYVIGPYDDGGVKFINRVCDAVTQTNKDYVVISKKSFPGSITKGGKRISKKTYLVNLQNPSAISYVITEDMVKNIETLEKNSQETT